jgi:lipoate-protein ligase A
MKFHLSPLPSPAEQLAGDEALLDHCESGRGEETLLFWEPRTTFVVVGYANAVSTEVNQAACTAAGVPVLRRCSGGGTVLQGVGCLNYALVLQMREDGPLRSITSANRFIMERNRAAIETLFPGSPPSDSRITVRGHTDLCMGDLKFSGNSQRRKKNFLLFHGSILLDFPLARVSELLPMPSLQPEYRARRRHDEFLINLHRPAALVQEALRTAWNANEPLQGFPEFEARQLAAEKYSTAAWNLKL